MNERRTARFPGFGNRFGWPGIRYEFGPWWWRWWLIVVHGGKPHEVLTGEKCVLFPISDADNVSGR